VYSPSPILNDKEKRKVFSRGLCTLEAENKYDKSISIVVYLKPAPKEKNLRAPLNSFSLK